MTNIIFSAKGKTLLQEEIVHLKQNLGKDTKLFVLCEKRQAVTFLQKLPEKVGIDFFVFPDATAEDEMISSCIKSIENVSPIVLIRSTSNFATLENIDILIQKIASGADLAMFRQTKKGGKVSEWFAKTYKRLCEIFFGFKFFEGNISLMAFSSNAHKILKETPVTRMTKINRWVGVDVQYVEKQSLPKNTPIKTPLNIIASCIVWACALFALLFCLIFFGVLGTLNVVSFLLYFGGVLLAGCLFSYRLLLLISHKHIGSVKSKSTTTFERRDL